MDKLKIILGTGFGSGLLPWGPGTMGSLAALLPLYFLISAGYYWMVPVLALVSCIITLWVSPYFEERWKKDPPRLVMDEWAGQSLALTSVSLTGFLSTDITILLSAFILFRIFDILKPLGVKQLQELPGGWGVLVDDLLAGLYALICLKTLIFVWPKYFGMA